MTKTDTSNATDDDSVEVYPYMAEERKKCPVLSGIGQLGQALGVGVALGFAGADIPVFTALGHSEVKDGFRDSKRLSSAVYMGMPWGPTLFSLDGAEHQRQRQLVNHVFRPKAVEAWVSEYLDKTVDAAIDRFVARGSAELVSEFTRVVPPTAIAQIIGLPVEDHQRFLAWNHDLANLVENYAGVVNAAAEMRTYFTSVIQARREKPGRDLISDLVAVEIDGETLSDDEIVQLLIVLLPAGSHTTYATMGSMLFGLLSNPEQLAAVAADRSLIPAAVEEAVRWETGASLFFPRLATEAVTLGDTEIPAGSVVLLALGSHNRDDALYSDPDEYNILRPTAPAGVFGYGPHVCLGIHLARAELRTGLSKLLDRLPNLRLDDREDPPQIVGFGTREVDRLPVVFDVA